MDLFVANRITVRIAYMISCLLLKCNNGGFGLLALMLTVWTSAIGKFIPGSALLWFQENNQAIVKITPFPGHKKNPACAG
jgi:hypothetical protein